MKNLENCLVELVREWNDDVDALEYIEKDMNSFATYVQSVYTMETRMVMAQAHYSHDVEKIAEIRYNLDNQRRNAHELAITSIKRLCRFATIKGVEPLYDGDLEDRYEIADFCRRIVLHFFDSGLSGTKVNHSFTHQSIDELVATAKCEN